MKKIVILTTHYGASTDLRKCLNSVELQEYDHGKYEVQHQIIIDGTTGKNSDIYGLINSCPSKKNTEFKINEKNKGKATCLNEAISKIDADLLMFLDSDDVFLPGKISLQLSYRERFQECVMGTGYYIYRHPHGFTDQFIPCESPTKIATNFIFFPHMLFSSMLISRRTIDNYLGCQPFNHKLSGGIDYEFYSKLLPHIPFRNLALPLVAYKISNDGITSSTTTRLEQIKTHIAAVKKLLEPSCLLAKLPNHAIMPCLFYSGAIDSTIRNQLFPNKNLSQPIKELINQINSSNENDVYCYLNISSDILPNYSIIKQQILRNLCSW